MGASRFVDVRALALGIGLAALISWAVHVWFDVGYWLVFGIATLALLVNGLVAVIEDGASGSVNNPGNDASADVHE